MEADDQGRPERAEHTTADLALHAWLDRDLSWLEFNRRVLATFNLREAYAFCQLRSAPNAHFSIRKVAERVAQEILQQ
jgi:hypothetical protein